MFTERELAWAAGLFEGEGTIRINKATSRNYGHVMVSVTNTDPEVLEFFQARWPAYMKKVWTRPDQRDAWAWVTAARKAMAFLDAIEPYIVTARVRNKLQVARQFQALKSTPIRERLEDYYEQGFNLYLWMRELNVRGVAA